MKTTIILAAMLSLTACAQLTGDAAKDCLAAANMANSASAAAALAQVNADVNPQSARMQQLAALAQAAAGIAENQRNAACAQ